MASGEQAIAAAVDATLPRSLASLRCLRQLLSVSIRSVGNAALPLPDLQLALLPPSPPAAALLELDPASDGSVRVRVGTRALAAPSAAPLHVTGVARETLNPTWQLDGSALPVNAQRLGAALFVLRRVSPGPTTELLCTELRLSSLIHVVERNGGGSVGMVGFDGLVGGLALLPPCSVVVELDVGGGARRTFSTWHALEPMAAAGLLARLSPAPGSPRGGPRRARSVGSAGVAGAAEGSRGADRVGGAEGVGGVGGAGGADGAGGVVRCGVADGSSPLLVWLERWVETEALPVSRLAASVEQSNARDARRLQHALGSRERAEERRARAAGEARELALLRRALAREREEVAAAERAVGEATRRAAVHAASASHLSTAAAGARAESAERSAAAVAESQASARALAELRHRRAAALRSSVVSLGRLLPCAGSPPTLCGLRVGGREEETSAALGLAATSVGALARMAGERLGLVLLLRGSRSAVQDEEGTKPLPLHGKGAEAGPGARMLLRSMRLLEDRLCSLLDVQIAPAAEAASAGAGVLLLLAGVYDALTPNAPPHAPKHSIGSGERHLLVGTDDGRLALGGAVARHTQRAAESGGREADRRAPPAPLRMLPPVPSPVRMAGVPSFFGQAAPLVDMPD